MILTKRWLVAQASGAAGGLGEGQANAKAGLGTEHDSDGTKPADRCVDDHACCATLESLAAHPRLVRVEVDARGASGNDGVLQEAKTKIVGRVGVEPHEFQPNFKMHLIAARDRIHGDFHFVGHAKLLTPEEAGSAEWKPVFSVKAMVERGPFVAPKPQGARDLSRHAEAKRTDPARIEADRKAREVETQKLGRAIQITNRRGQP